MDEATAYLHMDRTEMEDEIESGGFLEHGLYGEHLYGTKFDSVRRVIQSSKMCVLDIEPTVRRKRICLKFENFLNHLGLEINL
jgi:guanylate kinase